MAGERLKVEVLVGLVDRLSAPLRQLGGSVRKFGQDVALGGAGAAAFGAGLLAPLRSATLAFAESEDAATRFKLSMMDASGAVLPSYQALSNLAQQLGDRLPGSTADFLAMMTMLRRQGMDATTILEGTGEAAANLAVMLKMTPEAAAEFTAKLQDATGTAAKDMLALADTIQRTFNVGVDPTNMLKAYGSLSPAMALIKQQGIDGAQAMAPLLAMLDQASLTGEAAGNALRKVFSRSFGGTKKGDEAMSGAGLSFVDAKGEFLGLDNMFAQLSKLKAMSSQARLQTLSDIWGDDSETLQALNTMIEKGADGYRQMAGKLREQADLQKRMGVLLGTLKNLWDAASGTVTNLAARVGELLAPEIKALTEQLGVWAARVRAWIDANPELAKGLAKWAAIAGVALVVLGGLGIAVGVVATGLGALLSPLALTAVAFAGTAALIYKHWEPIAGFFSGLWSGLTEGLAPLVPAFEAAFGAMAPILEPVGDALQWVRDLLTDLLGPVETTGTEAEAMGRRWGTVIADMIQRTTLFVSDLMDIPGKMLRIGSDIVSGLWEGLKAKWDALAGWWTERTAWLGGLLRTETETHSPSRVFAAIGGDLIAGLQQGLAARIPAVFAQMQGLAAGLAATSLSVAPMAVPAATSPTAAGGGPPPITINVTINAPPGTDAAGLASLARRELTQAAQRVAALYDRSDLR